MRATSIQSADTRIVPASPQNKAVKITKGGDGSMAVQFGSGETGTLAAEDKDIQAFVIWTMLNGDCTRS